MDVASRDSHFFLVVHALQTGYLRFRDPGVLRLLVRLNIIEFIEVGIWG